MSKNETSKQLDSLIQHGTNQTETPASPGRRTFLGQVGGIAATAAISASAIGAGTVDIKDGLVGDSFLSLSTHDDPALKIRAEAAILALTAYPFSSQQWGRGTLTEPCRQT